MGFRDRLEQARRSGAFVEHIAGDVETFRYPHAETFAELFRFDERLKCWRLLTNAIAGEQRGDQALRDVRGFAAEDITSYEFLAETARRIHCLDMIGVPYDDAMRERAYSEVIELYENRDQLFANVELHSVCAADLPLRDEFAYLRELYRDVWNVPIHILQFRGATTWPFGSVLKGTDVLLTDGNPINFGQDIVHALYHLHEGIPGVNGDNTHVQELWAPVPSLYALQLAEGRLSRRIRLQPSPHPIHFTDYIFLRAYLGQAFGEEPQRRGGETVAVSSAIERFTHPAYAVIEPAIRLMVSPLGDVSARERNRILADAILADRAEELVSHFDNRYGQGSFAQVFDTYELYGKHRRALAFIDERNLDAIMFEGEQLLATDVPAPVVKRIWKDEELRSDPSSVLNLLGFK